MRLYEMFPSQVIEMLKLKGIEASLRETPAKAMGTFYIDVRRPLLAVIVVGSGNYTVGIEMPGEKKIRNLKNRFPGNHVTIKVTPGVTYATAQVPFKADAFDLAQSLRALKALQEQDAEFSTDV